VKITFESNIALGVQQTLGLLEEQTSLLIAMAFLFLRPANFSSNRNVALQAHSLGPPLTRRNASERPFQTTKYYSMRKV